MTLMSVVFSMYSILAERQEQNKLRAFPGLFCLRFKEGRK